MSQKQITEGYKGKEKQQNGVKVHTENGQGRACCLSNSVDPVK